MVADAPERQRPFIPTGDRSGKWARVRTYARGLPGRGGNANLVPDDRKRCETTAHRLVPSSSTLSNLQSGAVDMPIVAEGI